MKEDCSKININQKFRLCLFKSLIATVVCEKTKEPPAVLYTHKAVDCPQTAQCCFCWLPHTGEFRGSRHD